MFFGATGGIGSQLVRQLSSKGETVVLAARGRERLETFSAELGGVAFETVDVTSFSAVGDFVRRTKGEYGRLDGIVNTASKCGYIKQIRHASGAV